jgi:hypothetical protein
MHFHCPLGYSGSDVIWKNWASQTLDAYCNSKVHLYKKIPFFKVFLCSFGLQRLEKLFIWTNRFFKHRSRVSKNAEFDADFEYSKLCPLPSPSPRCHKAFFLLYSLQDNMSLIAALVTQILNHNTITGDWRLLTHICDIHTR